MTTTCRDDIADRFWAKVKKGPSCWEWMAGKTSEGYGAFAVTPRTQVKAHRFAYEQIIGPIPDGLHLDHLCRNRGCVNPSHVEPVTPGENVLRGVSIPALNARRTACALGHQFSVVMRGKRAGKRYCVECQNQARRVRRAAKRSAA
jgi:hypothetical protein